MKSILTILKRPYWIALTNQHIEINDFISVYPKNKYSSIYKVIGINPLIANHVAQDKEIVFLHTQNILSKEIYLIPDEDLPDFLK